MFNTATLTNIKNFLKLVNIQQLTLVVSSKHSPRSASLSRPPGSCSEEREMHDSCNITLGPNKSSHCQTRLHEMTCLAATQGYGEGLLLQASLQWGSHPVRDINLWFQSNRDHNQGTAISGLKQKTIIYNFNTNLNSTL